MAQKNNQNNVILSSLIASLSLGGSALAVYQGNALATVGFSSIGGAIISTVLSKKQDNSTLEEEIKDLKNKEDNKSGELEKNILELKTEIKDLNSKINQPDAEIIKAIANLQELLLNVNEKIINIKLGENKSVTHISTSAKPFVKPRPALIPKDENIKIITWLQSRNIEVNAHSKPHTLDESKYKIAVFLGEHYQVLEQLYDLIKTNMKKKINNEINENSSFPFMKLPENQAELDICIKFSEILYEAGFLVSPSPQLNTNKVGQNFLNIKTAKNEVMSNFISGMWFEYFIEQKVIMFLKEHNQNFECIKNVKVTLSNDANNSQNNELDLLFMVGEKLIWIECKSGNNYDQFWRKYSDLRKLLKFNIHSSFVVILLDEEAKLNELSEWWKLTVVNPQNLLEKIARILNIPFKAEKKALSFEQQNDIIKEFNELGFRVNDPKQPEKIDEEKRAIALFLGENYNLVQELHKLVKEHIEKKVNDIIDIDSILPFDKLPDDHDQIKTYLEFCQMLYQGKYLAESPSTEIKQNNAGKNYIVVKTAKNQDYEFLEVGWFKDFVEAQICKFLEENNKEFIYLKKEEGENNPTDLLFLVNNHLISVKCKIGNYDNHKVVNDYYEFGKKIKCPAGKLFLVIFDEKTDSLQKSFLKYKHKVTMVNQKNLIRKIEVLLNLLGEESPQEAINQNTNMMEVINPSPLYTLFNHRSYRPCPENRQEVIKELITIFGNIEQPVTMNYVKLQLVEKLGLSQSKLKEILKAIIYSNCLLNANGEVVNSFSESVKSLVSQDVQELDNKCIELYKQIVLESHPNYFDSEENIKLFEETVGGKLVNSI